MNSMTTGSRRLPGPGFEPRSLVDLLQWRALHQPNRQAYTFLSDGEAQELNLTYAELDSRARAVGALLQSKRAKDERVLLLYPSGLEYIVAFFGCLYAGAVAVPAYPPDPKQASRTMPRLRAILEDAKAIIGLTTSAILSKAPALFAGESNMKSMQWLVTDDIDDDLARGWQNPDVSGDTLAFLQYTSGSTFAPRAVMVSHDNVLANEKFIKTTYGHTDESTFVGWLPLYHDMGLVGDVLHPLYIGATCIFMSPASFLQKPIRWLQAISRYRAHTSGGPNFAYDLCVSKTSPEDRAGLDLSSWSVAFNGAEPIRWQTLQRFTAAFEPYGFRPEALCPCYGMAETTLMVSGEPKSVPPATKAVKKRALANNVVTEVSEQDQDAQVIVSCGSIPPDQRIAVVDTESLTECAPDRLGEIWVSGPSVARGYWNSPEKSEATFGARIAGSNEGPFLRTGDLGFVRDGRLYITGRLKDLIIIRGLNHYPQDIEFAVERSHEALRPGCGAAFSVEVAGEERLVVVQEVAVRKQPDLDSVIDSIRQAVAKAHELQVYGVALIRPGTIPKTSSGKIQRRACREKFLEGGLDEVKRSISEQSDSRPVEESLIRKLLLAVEPDKRQPLVESYLQEQLARALNISPSMINRQHSLTGLGIDSLTVVEVRSRIEQDLNVSIPPGSLLEATSISELARQVGAQLTSPSGAGLQPVESSKERRDEYALSYIQQALWFIHQMAPESAAYNVSFAARIYSEVDAQKLERALQALVNRHAPLRTTYPARDGQLLQRVDEGQQVSLETINSSAWNDDELFERLSSEAHRPFDLERGPVMRAVLFTSSAKEHVLLFAAHHIAIDGWSVWVLLDELRALYGAGGDGAERLLPPLPAEYVNYVRWQAEMLAGPEGERLWDYWRNELAGGLPALSIPTDRPRPMAQTDRGAAHQFRLSPALTEQLKAVAKSEETTLYTVLLATFQVLLHRYSDQEEIVVSSPASARSRAEFADLVGCFFNTLAMRADFSGDPTIREFIAQVRRRVIGALDHQEFPSHLLAEKFQPARDAAGSPLFQATFIMQKPHRFSEAVAAVSDRDAPPVHFGGLLLKPFLLERKTARSDLELEVIEAGGSLHCWLQYNTDLFNASTIARMAAHLQMLFEGIVANPQSRVSKLPLLTEAEREQLLTDWSGSTEAYPCSLLVHEMFEEQAVKSPDNTAAFFEGRRWTFQELNDQADRLAGLLRELKR